MHKKISERDVFIFSQTLKDSALKQSSHPATFKQSVNKRQHWEMSPTVYIPLHLSFQWPLLVSLLQEKLALCLEDFRQKQSKSLEMTCMRPEVTDSGPLSVARFILNVFEKVDQTHSWLFSNTLKKRGRARGGLSLNNCSHNFGIIESHPTISWWPVRGVPHFLPKVSFIEAPVQPQP